MLRVLSSPRDLVSSSSILALIQAVSMSNILQTYQQIIYIAMHI